MSLFSSRKFMAARGCLAALCLGVFTQPGVLADDMKTRLAVIGDADSRDLSALVVMELSSRPDVALVEREDLARLGDERRLQRLAGRDAVALGKMVGADGLLFVDKTAAGYTARFTAVGLGYALFSDELGLPKSLDPLARSLAHRLGGYVPKLRLDPVKITPLSILNLRADLANARSTALERDLTLLLESRLSAVPEYVVLERRHAGALGFERSLNPEASTPPPGSCLLDGTFGLPSPGTGELTVRLRLRGPSAGPVPLEVTGREDDLPGLTEKLTAAIRQAVGRTDDPPAWQPEKEAHEYLAEAIWGWRHNAPDAALEAVESAELLGEKAADLTAVRVNLLAARTGRGMELHDTTPGRPLPAADHSLDERTDDALAVLRETIRYADEKMASKLRWLDPNPDLDVRTGNMKHLAVNLGSLLVAYLDKAGSPRADELRAALRPITHYDPLHGRIGEAMQGYDGLLRDRFADQWAASLEEELAYDRLILTATDQFFPSGLINGGAQGFCPRFLPTPEARRTAYEQFVQELKNEPAGRVAALLITACSRDPATADAAYTAWTDEMWNRRDLFLDDKSRHCEWINSRAVPDDVRRRHAAGVVPVLRYYLQHRRTFSPNEFCLMTMWQPDGWSEPDAATVLADFRRFREGAEQARNAPGKVPVRPDPYYLAFEARLLQRFPALAAPAPPVPSALVVTRYWHPTQPFDGSPTRYELRRPVVSGDNLFVLGFPEGRLEGCAVYRVGLPDLVTEAIAPPEKMNPQDLTVTSDALYLDYYPVPGPGSGVPPHRIGVFDRRAQTWVAHDIPVPFMHHYAVGGSFYLNLTHWTASTSEEDGLARYDLATGQAAVLASSRRNPPRNQFENRTGASIGPVFPGPGGRPCAVTGLGVFYVQEQAGEWPEVFDASHGLGTAACGEATLVYNHFGEVVLLDPARPGPEYLMAPTRPLYRKTAVGRQKPSMQLAPWLEQARWRAPENCALDPGSRPLIGWHGDRLFILAPPAPGAKNYELLVYAGSAGQAPRRIPLTFRLDDATRAQLAPTFQDLSVRPGAWTLESVEHPDDTFARIGLLTAPTGLCLTSDNGGTWFVPYADIDQSSAGPDVSPRP